MTKLAKLILDSKSLLLSTHRQCDGDGLGAELALYHSLKAHGKTVHIVNVDETPRKYRFLNPEKYIQIFEENPILPSSELALIFDTNDERIVEPLFSALKAKVDKILFVDHHPLLKNGPLPSVESIIDTTAASTGELAFRVIKEAGLPITKEVATCLYTSITFDTQLYRFVKNSPNSHLIAAEMIKHNIDVEEVHRALFGNQSIQKMAFMSKVIGQIEYFADGKIAVLKVKDKDMEQFQLEPDDSRDVIDMLMNIETLEAAALFREDGTDEYKLSLRSKGKIEVLTIAESLGGGGHTFAAGAFIKKQYPELKKLIVDTLTKSLKALASAS